MRGGSDTPRDRPAIVLLLLLLLLLLLCRAEPPRRTNDCAWPAATMASPQQVAAELLVTVRKLTEPGKGVLAADESTATAGKRVSCLVDLDGAPGCCKRAG